MGVWGASEKSALARNTALLIRRDLSASTRRLAGNISLLLNGTSIHFDFDSPEAIITRREAATTISSPPFKKKVFL